MKSSERIAYIRIFTDLIMADTVIDAGEIDNFGRLRSFFRFTRQEEIDAQSLNLAEAIQILRASDNSVKVDLIERLHELSISDGFCARSEALLVSGIEKCLDSFWGEVSQIYSFPKQVFNIPTSCIIYIESRPTEFIDAIVENNYRSLFSEFRLAGFEFIYIPHIIKHYRESDPELIKDIVGFVAPRLSESGCKASVEKLLQMTTAEFTKDILCNKLGMDSLRNTSPALLLKIGNSFVGEDVYANYLKMDIEGDVIKDVHNFIDNFTAMLSTDVVIVSNNKEQHNQFLYSGFYKLLLDTHLMRRHVRSRVYFNPYKEEIYFPDIDTVLNGLHRREKALYLTLLIYSDKGGVNFTVPIGATRLKKFNDRMKSVQKVYAYIYGIFGGDKQKAPDLSQPEIRRPMFSLIKRHLTKLSEALYNIGDYLISKDDEGTFFVHLQHEEVYVKNYKTGDMQPLADWEKSLAMLQL